MKSSKKQLLKLLHLVKGQYKVKWYESEKQLRSTYQIWPPQSSGGCELRAPDRKHRAPWCENKSCNGICMLNGVPGADGTIYWYCTCRKVKA